ncbi:hypothetical protein [Streptomyces chengmaiensis]|nr:hypothetical protein [Streptomyces chengmaiensis]
MTATRAAMGMSETTGPKTMHSTIRNAPARKVDRRVRAPDTERPGRQQEQMRDLLDASDRLDGDQLTPRERQALLERVRGYEEEATEQVARLRVQLARTEEFARTLRERVERSQEAVLP